MSLDFARRLVGATDGLVTIDELLATAGTAPATPEAAA